MPNVPSNPYDKEGTKIYITPEDICERAWSDDDRFSAMCTDIVAFSAGSVSTNFNFCYEECAINCHATDAVPSFTYVP